MRSHTGRPVRMQAEATGADSRRKLRATRVRSSAMTPDWATRDEPPEENLAQTVAPLRVHVDGKFFTRGNQRLRICGVTYGPFAPGSDGHPFPTPARAADDLARMRAVGINAIRT